MWHLWISAGSVSNLQAQIIPLVANPPASLPAGAVLFDQQAHIKIDRTVLPSDPTKAALQTDLLRRQLERQFLGQIKAVDNLSGAFQDRSGGCTVCQNPLYFSRFAGGSSGGLPGQIRR